MFLFISGQAKLMFGSAVHFQMKWERQEKNKPETKKKRINGSTTFFPLG